ncbi:hypothetical protein [Streptomyces sp. NPDC012888]|uniref:hypothetical protein n=1 Tax=Streptomyces sp. NPDC012888 TaxID=3364855 RepID=UPI0036B74558
MLALRLVRGSRPLVQVRRLLVALACAGTGFLLLAVLADATARPAGSFPRLLWALVPLVLTVRLAVAVARTDPATRPADTLSADALSADAPSADSLSAAGLGPVRLGLVAAVSTAVTCALGSALALAAFLHLRGDLTGLPFDGAAAGPLHAGRPLPSAAALTLLALVPLAGSAGAALTTRTRSPRVPWAGLPWGVALAACGPAAGAYAGPRTAGLLAAWSLTALGLALAGPGLLHACGALVQAVRPGALRLLAGRPLQEEAGRLGGAVGVACAVAAAGFAAPALRADGGLPAPLGALTGPAAALVLGCAAAILVAAAVETRQSRAASRATLLELGTPVRMLRTAAALRVAAVLLVCVPVSWGTAQVAAAALAR